jgi:hypothetical protein
MSRENVELLRRGYEHVENTGELLREVARSDFVWDTTTFRGAIRPGTFVGIDETNAWKSDGYGPGPLLHFV